MVHINRTVYSFWQAMRIARMARHDNESATLVNRRLYLLGKELAKKQGVTWFRDGKTTTSMIKECLVWMASEMRILAREL